MERLPGPGPSGRDPSPDPHAPPVPLTAARQSRTHTGFPDPTTWSTTGNTNPTRTPLGAADTRPSPHSTGHEGVTKLAVDAGRGAAAGGRLPVRESACDSSERITEIFFGCFAHQVPGKVLYGRTYSPACRYLWVWLLPVGMFLRRPGDLLLVETRGRRCLWCVCRGYRSSPVSTPPLDPSWFGGAQSIDAPKRHWYKLPGGRG